MNYNEKVYLKNEIVNKLKLLEIECNDINLTTKLNQAIEILENCEMEGWDTDDL